MNKSAVISKVCSALSAEAIDKASAVLRENYPFAPEAITKRKYGALRATGIFIRDGFIDRYSGERLIFPPVFRVLSVALPSEFPYHPNWKTEVTHPAYWELGATIDHLKAVALGGLDDEDNWITTSMAHNQAKMNWSLEQLKWNLHPPGDFQEWDGLLHWFLEYTTHHKDALNSASVRQWHKAARLLLA